MRFLMKLLPAMAMACPATVAFAADRIELPVRAVTLSDGTRRFGVPIMVDGRSVETGLDTGSTGLRVMARSLPNTPGRGATIHYGYGSGTQLDGHPVTVPVAFGALAGSVKVERVEALSCLSGKPRCPASRNADPATFGIQGDGLPNEGLAGILGVNLRPDSVPNPFEALGLRRWIIELPRPGASAAGRIILNPSAADMEGFTAYRLLPDENSVAGCITGPEPLGRVCGPATLDSGAPGLRIVDARHRPGVPNGTPVALTLGDDRQQASAQLEVGRRDQASRLTVEQQSGPAQPRLFFGIAPYFRWSVLYDADAHTIALKPR